MRTLVYTIFITWSIVIGPSVGDTLETMAQWSLLNFALPYDSGFLNEFRPENVVPTGFEVTDHRIFITIPRLRSGVPATLATFPRNLPRGSSPQLQAYPSWDWHQAGNGDFNCSGLISVYRVRVDRCNRLWVADSGVNTSLEFFRPVCPPKLLVFDLQTDQLVRQIIFPREVLRPATLLTNLVIDDTEAQSCDDVFVYLTDTIGPGIQIFDGRTDRSWRVLHASMLPDPDYTQHRIGSETFELMDGVVGLSFSPRENLIYYQPVASDRIFSVSTTALKSGPVPFGQQLPVTLVGKKSSQGLALATDPYDGTLYFSPFTETAIATWNPRTNQQRISVRSQKDLQFVADIKLVEQENNFWVFSTRFQKFFNNNLDTQDINIRLMRIRQKHASENSRLNSHLISSNVVPTLYQFGSHLPYNFYNNSLTVTSNYFN